MKFNFFDEEDNMRKETRNLLEGSRRTKFGRRMMIWELNSIRWLSKVSKIPRMLLSRVRISRPSSRRHFLTISSTVGGLGKKKLIKLSIVGIVQFVLWKLLIFHKLTYFDCCVIFLCLTLEKHHSSHKLSTLHKLNNRLHLQFWKMVLTELGNKITNALRKMADSTVINDDVLDEMLKEICNALVFNYLFLEKISNCFPTLSFSP